MPTGITNTAILPSSTTPHSSTNTRVSVGVGHCVRTPRAGPALYPSPLRPSRLHATPLTPSTPLATITTRTAAPTPAAATAIVPPAVTVGPGSVGGHAPRCAASTTAYTWGAIPGKAKKERVDQIASGQAPNTTNAPILMKTNITPHNQHKANMPSTNKRKPKRFTH